MKRYHLMKLGDKQLKLSLSFGTSLEIMEEVASPSMIIEGIMQGMLAARDGREYEAEFQFNERNAVKIIEIASRPYDGLSFDEVGNLAVSEGFLNFYGHVTNYLTEMVMGRSKELKLDEEADSGEK